MSPPSAAAPKLPEGSTEYSRARKGCLDLVASIATLTTMVANLVDSKVPVQWVRARSCYTAGLQRTPPHCDFSHGCFLIWGRAVRVRDSVGRLDGKTAQRRDGTTLPVGRLRARTRRGVTLTPGRGQTCGRGLRE
jgi:hypothetical protein